MDFQQKAAALESLAEISIRMRKVCDWYVSQSVEIKDAGCLVGKYGNGRTPEEAIEDHWRVLVDELPKDQYLVVNATSESRAAFRWNGFMWEAVTERHTT